MSRLFSTIKTDLLVQVRNNLYTIGIGVAVVVAVILSQLASPEYLCVLVPTIMLMVVGGSTLLYVAGMMLFEKEEGTLQAIVVSPLRTAEYLWSKIITLTFLATLEAAVMIFGAVIIIWFSVPVVLPNIPVLFAGIIAIGVLYTLIGVILIVRYNAITDFLIPMVGIAMILQLPALYFLGMVRHWFLLLIPTSAPTLLMQGAYISLPLWQWIYAVVYTVISIVGFSVWAHRAFTVHVVAKGGR